MIYLDNNTLLQELYIPRQEYISVTTGSGGTYAEGYDDGVNDQKAKLASTAFTENGDYQRNDGWSAITVNVPQSGSVLEGKEIVVSQDVTIVVPTSGYDGFSAVTVDATEYGQTNYDSGFDDGFTDGYSSGSSEGYDSGYTDGYTSGETRQKGLLTSTEFTENGEYQREDGWSAISVNVPQSSIEQNKSFTATSNGDYIITPSSGITTVTDRFDSDVDRYYITATTSGFPLTGRYNLFYIEDEFDSSKGQIDVYIENGYLDYDDSDWYGGEIVDLSVGRNIDLFIRNANRDFEWYPLEDFDYHYDAMSAVTLNVNVPQTGHTDQELEDAYNSGYTSGETVGENTIIATFSSMTATTNGQYGSSANPLSSITVNVPTGSTATLGVGSFSANGTYSASTDNLDGYSAITINVPQTGGTSVKYVEYLETDGGLLAWDTSVRITDINDVVYFDFMPINWGSGQSPVGTWFPFLIDGDGSDNFNALIRCFLFDSPANGLCFEAFDYAHYKAMKYSGFTVDTRNNCIFSKNGLTINESVIQFSASNVFNTRTICINGEFNGDGGPVFKSAKGRYYGFKLIHSGQTISDLRPCLDGNDVPCFYDEVSQTYIYHSGSGTPIAGPIVDESYESGYTDGYTSGYTDGSASIASLIDRSITEVVIPSGVTTIGYHSFASCQNLKSITIPNSVTLINGNAFYGCYALSSITIPSGVTLLGGSCFYNNYALSSITIPNSVTYIGNQIFYNCQALTSVTFSNSLTEIPSSCCNGCKLLPNVTIPNSITTIGSYSFQNCSALTEVNIGSGVTKIETQAFRNCIALTNIYISATTAPTIANANTFQGVPSTGTVHYPQGSDYSSWQSNTYLSGWTFIADL